MVKIINTPMNFPISEFSYECIVHKKINNFDIALAIPKGDRYIAWFSNETCKLMKLNGNKIINTQTYHNKSETKHSQDCDGVILYGVVFFISNMRFFAVTDTLYYCGMEWSNVPTEDKIIALEETFSSGIFYGYSHSIRFVLPHMGLNFFQVIKDTVDMPLPYRTEYIMFMYGSKSAYIKYFPPKQSNVIDTTNINEHRNKKGVRTFLIKADATVDTYLLYDIESGDFFDNAYIPDYKTSTWMNSLFRNIKENTNFALLEESDSEEEFEAKCEDGFIKNPGESKEMDCMYHEKFHKWVPVSVK
jgi:hypothetical protein